jgi:oligoendopeptidase F
MTSSVEAAPIAQRWDLSDLYSGPEDPAIHRDLARSLERAKGFKAAGAGRTLAALSAAALLDLLQAYENIQEEGLKPYLYASLLFAEDTQNDRFKTLLQKAKETWSEVENHILPFRLEIIGLPEERLRQLLQWEGLVPYAHSLSFLRRFRKHTLGQKEEEILTRKNMTGRSAFTSLWDEFTGSFTFRFNAGGEEKERTGSEMLALLYADDRPLREQAFRSFLQHHGRNELVLTSIFNSLVLDHRVEDEIRGYAGPMDRTHLENEIRPETVDLLMDLTEKNYPLAQEYFQIKACLLGLPKLKNSDLYAPLPGGKRDLDFSQARELLLNSFQRFHPRFGEIAREVLDKRWIDAEVRQGKYGGAFCSGLTPSLHPCVLLNYTGHLRDALTLAHEMGHAIHFYLARKQSLLNFDPSLPVAETASVFGEMIMMEALLEKETDIASRQALLCCAIEDIIATVFRQNVLTRFEKAVYDRRRDHLLTAEEIGDLWWQANHRLFGDSVEMIPDYRWGWAYISHFIHSRFYCYSYIFGELVVLALFAKYREEGESFLPGLIRLLESGGSRTPDEMLLTLGLDVNRAEFWEKGFLLIRGLLDELKSLGPWDRICTEQAPRNP